jgi:lycopene cyclase CruP
LQSPHLIPGILQQVGVGALLNWMRHFGALGLYSTLSFLDKQAQDKPQIGQRQYRHHRWQDAFRYGSGLDIKQP